MAVKRSLARPTTTTKAKKTVKAAGKPTTARERKPVASAPARRKAAGRPAAATPAARAKSPAKVAKRVAAAPTVQQVVLDALHDMKAVDVKALDVRGLTDITDTMVVASGTSSVSPLPSS